MRARRPSRSSASGLTLAPTQWVINGVHSDAAYFWPLATPPLGSGLAQLIQLVLGISDFAQRRHALAQHESHLPAPKLQRYVFALLGNYLGSGASGPTQLRPFPNLELDTMYRRAERDVLERKRTAYPDIASGPSCDSVSNFEPARVDDIPLLSIPVNDQGDPRATIWIVLDLRNSTRHTEFISLEVDHPVAPLVTATSVTCSNVTLVVTPPFFLQRSHERLLRLRPRHLDEIGYGSEPGTWAHRPKFSNPHSAIPRRSQSSHHLQA